MSKPLVRNKLQYVPPVSLTVPSKSVFYERWHYGGFGNKLRSWSRLEDIPPDFNGTLMIRRQSAMGGSETLWTDKTLSQVRSIVKKGVKGKISFSENAPDDHGILQGELYSHEGALKLFGHIRTPDQEGQLLRMRDVLPYCVHYEFGVRSILKQVCTTDTYDDLMELVELYDGHVIEFTVFRDNLGWSRGRNAIIWEVRRY